MCCKLTVGIAVYNVKDYLKNCVASVLTQTSKLAQSDVSIEILIVDDGSTDGCGLLCQQIAESDSRVRLITFAQNRGICQVRNTIIRQAKGDWIYFVDGDDVLPPHFLDVALKAANLSCDMVLFHFARFETEPEFLPANNLEAAELPKVLSASLSRYCIGMHKDSAILNTPGLSGVELTSIWGKTYRRSFLLEHDIYFPNDQRKSQDMVFNILAYHFCRNVALIPVQMYGYRVNPQSVCNRYNPEMANIIRTWFDNTLTLMNRLYPGDAELACQFYQSSVILGLINCVRLNFFHPQNPKPFQTRKQEFLSLLSQDPFQSAIENLDINSYYFERQLVLKSIQKRWALFLNFSFRHPFVFRLYGGARNRLNKLKHTVLPKRGSI